MRKITIEFIISVAVLLGIWLILSQVDWMTLFKVRQATQNTGEKVGNLCWDLLKKSETEISADSVVSPIDSILTKICDKNQINRSKIRLHLLVNDEINAFALPNNHLIVYSGLVKACKSEAELDGVICHELAHLEKNHVMNKLVKEVGLSVLLTISAGNGNSGMVKRTLKQLSSSAYDRKMETEADLTAVDYLIKTGIDPKPFANFLYRLSDETQNIPEQIYWIGTHPESKKRADEIIKHSQTYKNFKATAIDSTQFTGLKENLNQKQ